MSAPYWVDIIGEVVAGVQGDSDKPVTLSSAEPYYMYGHPVEIIDILAQKDAHDTLKFQKFPVIALFQDFEESMGQTQTNLSTAELRMIIAMNTKQEYTSEQRYTNVFKPVLYPLYDLLMKHIVRSGYFNNVTTGLISHTKIDRLFWGRSGLYGNEANIFNDHIDAIEIQNLVLDLRIKQKICN